MKIFLSVLQGPSGYPVPSYSFWEYYFKNGIIDSGHQYFESDVDWAYGLVPKTEAEQSNWKSLVWGKTVDFIKQRQIDLFLSYLYPEQIDTSAIEEIKRMGVPTVNFFCDNVRQFKKLPKVFGCFDLNWVPEYKALAMYKKADISHIHLPMPMWVEPKLRRISNQETDRISFIGSHDIQRQIFLEQWLEKDPGIYLDIYGTGWKNENVENKRDNPQAYNRFDQLKFQVRFIKEQGLKAYGRKLAQRKFKPEFSSTLIAHLKGKPNFDEYIRLSKQSLITLGINRYPSFRFPLLQPDTYSRLRDIEAPMLGACYLTEWTEGLDEMFNLEKEILVYRDIDELIAKVERLQKDPHLRKQIRITSQQRALGDLSIANSLNRLAEQLQIS